MFVGMLGIYIEITHPGSMLPGVVGAICLILGFYALSVLPINYAGFALMLLAMILFFAETQVPSFGILSLGGTLSLVLGGMMLFKDVDPSMAVNPWLFVSLGGTVALVMASLSWKALQMRRRRATTGREGLLGERGVARGDLAPRGKVFVHGEIWNAVAQGLEADVSLPAGAPVEVVAVEGLTLLVKPCTERAPAVG
jgi:membrane-bound serine protease (ClpP class)